MTTLAEPDNIPAIGLDLSNTETREHLHDLAIKDQNDLALNKGKSPCAKGGTCECPRSKVALGLSGHECNPDPKVRCVVWTILCTEKILLV